MKISFLKKDQMNKLQEYISKSHLERKYEGKINDFQRFWPPFEEISVDLKEKSTFSKDLTRFSKGNSMKSLNKYYEEKSLKKIEGKKDLYKEDSKFCCGAMYCCDSSKRTEEEAEFFCNLI